AVLRFAYDNVAELLWRRQAPLSQHRIGELLVFLSWLATNLARRIYRVLRLDSINNIRDGDAQLGQLVRFNPKPHGVLPRAEDLGLSDAVQAGDGIVEIDVGIVRQIGRITSPTWRVQRDQHQRS